MTFEDVRRQIKRTEVLAGMDRMQPEMRELATRLLARFAEGNAAPLSIADEGAAIALWAPYARNEFLEWHREQGGLARALEVLLAAVTYERASYEWDSSVWALRRARPSAGFGNLGATPWLWLRDEVAEAKPAERKACREIASRASKAWLARAAIAFVFPDDRALWTAADEAELRQLDVDDQANQTFGLLVAMRGAKLDRSKIERNWDPSNAIPAKQLVDQLGDHAVAPLRLIRGFDELARLGVPDALRVLAEFADEAWEAIATVKPSKHSIAALAPMFGKQRPRRVLGLQLARGLVNEFVVAAPAEAEQVARGTTPDAAFVATVIAETGAQLPADAEWTSPWAAPAKSAKQKPEPRLEPVELSFKEQIRWERGKREQALGEHVREPRDAKTDRAKEAGLKKDARANRAFMLELAWMTDAPALRVWKAIEPKRWYGQVDDVEHVLARFGLAELDSVLAFVQLKPDTLAALAPVESPRVAPLMARGRLQVARARAAHAPTYVKP